ncbi:hypothetical protein BGZ60DRAFT_563417 [Tricladium varicosporioides]|nr:hypothetical protein BGZ60DRAFT_563417 [Hymenoscyphus varicosporioides]
MMAQLSLEGLCPEILALIFEELYKIQPEIFGTLKTLSRNLNVLATPFRYRRIVLQAGFFQVSGEVESSSALSIICLHSRHLVVKYDLGNWGAVEKLLLQCMQLQDLTWYLQNDASPLPVEIARALSSRLPPLPIHLHVRGRPSSWAQQTNVADSFSTLNLRSLNIQLYAQARNFKQFNKLLVGSRDLESLTLLAPFNFLLGHPIGRLPPIRELILMSYGWSYSETEVSQIWDFSKLLYLEIGRVSLIKFFSTLPMVTLSNLRELHISITKENIRSAVGDHPSTWSQATKQLERLFNVVRQLEVVDITCDVRQLSLHGIAQNRNLRLLRLRDITEFHHSTIVVDQQSVVSVADLELLSQGCPLITELDLGYPYIGDSEYLDFLAVFPKFQNLQLLSLRRYIPWPSQRTTTNQVDISLASAKFASLSLQTGRNAPFPTMKFIVKMRASHYDLRQPLHLQETAMDIVREIVFGHQGTILKDKTEGDPTNQRVLITMNPVVSS